MDTDKLNKWLTLLANFGVVIGIILLVIEVRQNQTLLQQNQELMQREYDLEVVDGLMLIADSADELRRLVVEYPDIARLRLDGDAGKELSEIDASRYLSLCSMSIWNDAVLHHRNMVLGQLTLATAEEVVIRDRIANAPGFKACWESQVDGLRLWGFGDLVESVHSN